MVDILDDLRLASARSKRPFPAIETRAAREITRLREQVAAQSAALGMAKAAITKLCIYNEDGGLQRIADAALAAIEALPAAPKGGAE